MSAAYAPFDDTPSRTGVLLALVPATLAVAASATVPSSAVATALGALVLLGGIRLGSRKLVTVGTIALFGGVLLAGALGGSVLLVSVGACATLIAWDAGTNAIGVANQLGTEAATGRLLLAHTLATTLVGAVVTVAAVAVYWSTRGGEPTAAVVLLLVAALAFVWLLDR